MKKQWRVYWPDVPADVRDDLALLRHNHLRAQVPLLYLTTIFVVALASRAAHPSAPLIIKYGLPYVVIAACAGRLFWWLRTANRSANPREARKLIGITTVTTAVICSLASLWSVMSWVMTVSDQRVYYPVFMVIGALAAAFCLSTIRGATHLAIITGIGPSVAVLLAAGSALDRLAAGVVAIGTAFLLKMIHYNHAQQVRTLLLQRDMRQTAATDPLTGLPNRRALYAALDDALTKSRLTSIALLDLDDFKPVNDMHGHVMGDRLLAELAQRLQQAIEGTSTAYRLGGDEFAIVPDHVQASDMAVVTTTVLAHIARPIVIDGIRFSIGASVGTAVSQPGDSSDALISRADKQLYAAKAGRIDGPARARRRRA